MSRLGSRIRIDRASLFPFSASLSFSPTFIVRISVYRLLLTGLPSSGSTSISSGTAYESSPRSMLSAIAFSSCACVCGCGSVLMLRCLCSLRFFDDALGQVRRQFFIVREGHGERPAPAGHGAQVGGV